MEDFLGSRLSENDVVIFQPPPLTRNVVGTIIKLSGKKLLITYDAGAKVRIARVKPDHVIKMNLDEV